MGRNRIRITDNKEILLRGHSDENRSLRDRGLPEKWKDSDELKHQKEGNVNGKAV